MNLTVISIDYTPIVMIENNSQLHRLIVCAYFSNRAKCIGTKILLIVVFLTNTIAYAQAMPVLK